MLYKGVASTRKQRLNFFTALKVITRNDYMYAQDNFTNQDEHSSYLVQRQNFNS